MLVAESGSTKTEWRYCRRGNVAQAFKSAGFNPNVMHPDQIREQFADVKQQLQEESAVNFVYFYGAGTRGENQHWIIKSALADTFPEAEIFIGYDLLAAARSSRKKEGIACILGTGSNSCYHKDFEIKEIRGGLGYLFGDEGSGADLGKHLIKGLLQGDFPIEIKDFIEEKEGKNLHQISMEIIRDPKPNVKMASLTMHLPKIIKHDSIEEMVIDRFSAFLDTTVCRIHRYQSLPLDIIGSIGYHFSKQFREAARRKDIFPSSFIKDPVDNLVLFHLNQ